MYQTEVDDVTLAILGFQGRLAAGVGKSLRLYDIGKKKLLRKVENKARRSNCECNVYQLTGFAELPFDYRHVEHARFPPSRRRHARIDPFRRI